MKSIFLSIGLALCAMIILSCGGSDRCFDCTLGDPPITICESTFQQFASRDGLEVNSLDEYIDAIGPNGTGFTCVELED